MRQVTAIAPGRYARCPACAGTDAVDCGRGITRCPIAHDVTIHGVQYVTSGFAADWRLDQLSKISDGYYDEQEVGGWLA